MNPMNGISGNYPASYKQKLKTWILYWSLQAPYLRHGYWSLQAPYLSLRFEVKKVRVLTDKTKWGGGQTPRSP